MTSVSFQQLAAQRQAGVRRQWLTRMICGFLLIAVIAVLVAYPIRNQRFHRGSYSNNYSADFDVNRVEYPLVGDVVLNRTAHEIYISVGPRPRITLWQMI